MLWYDTNVSNVNAALIFSSVVLGYGTSVSEDEDEDDGSMVLRNVPILPQHYTA